MADIIWSNNVVLFQEKFNHREMTEFFTKDGEKIEYVEMYWFVDLYSRLYKYKQPPHSPGVYMWFNVTKQIGYVGSTKDLYRRRGDFLNLRNNYGDDILNEDRNKHPEDFVLLILEHVKDPNILKSREQFYISKYNTLTEGYNLMPSLSEVDSPTLKNIEDVDTTKERTIIHLHFLENDKHYYFGSMASMYDYFDATTLGVTYHSLRNYVPSMEKPFKNDICIIRKGVLISKKSKRGTSIKRLFENTKTVKTNSI